MKRDIITISEGGVVTIPNGVVRMNVNEIALLFEVMLPTVRGKIRALHNSRALLDCDMNGGVVMGNRVIPEYFGLEVVIAVAFQLDGYKAEVFRKWILRKMAQPTKSHQPIYINIDKIQGNILN
ncbi:MAG: hypothetical protein SNG35_05900 [Rikenellaceae bacterium]